MDDPHNRRLGVLSNSDDAIPVLREAPPATQRPPIESIFQTQVKVIDGLLTLGDSALNIQTEKTVLKIGEDLLQFQVQSPVSGFVAVYVRASDNSLIQFLPNARVPALAIEANTPLRLPPANEPIQAAGPAGENQFLVVVTEQPRNYDHLQFQDHYGFGLIQTNQNGSGFPALKSISRIPKLTVN